VTDCTFVAVAGYLPEIVAFSSVCQDAALSNRVVPNINAKEPHYSYFGCFKANVTRDPSIFADVSMDSYSNCFSYVSRYSVAISGAIVLLNVVHS